MNKDDAAKLVINSTACADFPDMDGGLDEFRTWCTRCYADLDLDGLRGHRPDCVVAEAAKLLEAS